MYLKSLKLAGFKSFADRTRLEFRPGVSVIVGPNGSGKSNVVDAIAWVMGTQSPKALRTGKMDDVIFAGTATRPGLGRAEVTLVFDNGSGMLAIDLPEVSITRRLYRDGSSDYEINGVGCRLLDIQELLSDSGVGRHQHIIIGQGQIDSILNATPDEHRAVIEEAAGILKHRLRKEKAIRRLEQTDQDVLRLQDLTSELARQMRPLKRQADAAARRDSVAAEMRALRLFIGGEQLRHGAERRGRIADEEHRLRQGMAEEEAELAELVSVLGILRRAAGEVGEALDRDSSAAARLETTIERLRRIAQVAHERLRAGRTRLEGADERRRDLDAEQRQLRGDLAEVAAGEEELRRRSDAAERRFRALEDEERSLADQEGMTVEGAIAVVRGDLRSLDAAADRDERELASVRRRREALTGRRDSEAGEIERLNDSIREIDALVGGAQGRYAAAEAARREEQDAWEEAETRHADARVTAAAARARLEAVEQAGTGLADPEARSLVEAAAGAVGSVTSRLDVPAHLAAALDAALGPWADAVAFAAPDSLVAAVASLKGEGRGGIPMVASTGSAPSAATRVIAEQVGLTTLIDELGPAADVALAEQLVGDVLVAEGWQAAWQVVERHPQVRVVTPEGDLIGAHGVRVAHPDGASPAMIEAAAAALEAAETELARRASLLAQRKRSFDDARGSEREALEQLESLEARLAGATEALGRLRRTLGSVEDEVRVLDERAAALEEAASARTGQRARLLERLGTLEGAEAERQKAWDEMEHRRQAISAERESARAAWQESTSVLRGAVERRSMIESRLEAVDGLLRADAGEGLDPARLDRLGVIEANARLALDVLRGQLDALRARQSELRGRAGETGRRLGAVQDVHDRLTGSLAEARDRLSAIAVEATELRVRTEAVAEGLRRDLDASEEEAMAAPQPAIEGDLAAALESREAELRRMGPVNPLAAEEYAEVSQRHAFLVDQLDDLERSRDELRKVIRALDGEIQARFAQAFGEIADAYERHFGVLFPGGRGRLRLGDPDHPLTSGVEIEAQPLGKKVSKMTLLSGGERSLAALAFLFAIFESRPSPFYVLDEVEAALDDANLRRFLRLLEAFRSQAQLLVVTHQQQTMETADVLYGVTMEPGGSSKAVAKAMTESTAPV